MGLHYVQAYVYDDEKVDETLDLINSTSQYALTGAMYVSIPPQPRLIAHFLTSFASERKALIHATSKLRHAAGNVYYNEKCTGAVVGQQPFGGARASGTNDKAGSMAIFYRFVSARSIKENFVGLESYLYPSNFE